MAKRVDPELSRKRSEAGRKGAASRWHRDGKPDNNLPELDGKPKLGTTRPIAKLMSGRNDWYNITNRKNDVAEIYIYDEIGYFGVTASDFVNDLQNVTAKTINLHVNTPGGDVFDGLAIYNALKNHSATVNVFIDALAASAGAFISQAGDTVSIARNGMMMIHDAMGLVIGNAEVMREAADLYDMHSDNIADIYAQRTGGTKEEFREMMREETWFSSDEAVEAGLADEVTGGDTEDAKNSFDLSVFRYSGREEAPEPKVTNKEDEEEETENGNAETKGADLARLFQNARNVSVVNQQEGGSNA